TDRLPGQAVPGRHALVGDVEDARVAADDQAADGGREVDGERRTPVLVVDHLELTTATSPFDDRAHEVAPRGAAQPRRPNEEVLAAQLELAASLRPSVDGAGVRDVPFEVRSSCLPVEDVV